GRFVGGFSGEQYALPEAIGLLRQVRRQEASGALVTLSGADPLNLVGIVTPGDAVPAFATNRILYRDGIPVAAKEGEGRGERFLRDGGPDEAELRRFGLAPRPGLCPVQPVVNDARVAVAPALRQDHPEGSGDGGEVGLEADRHLDVVAAALRADVVTERAHDHPGGAVGERRHHERVGEAAHAGCFNLSRKSFRTFATLGAITALQYPWFGLRRK